MHFPSQPDTGRSDIIIHGQSCWQRNANIDLAAQSLTKLLSSLSHEAQWCLYGNFMRTLKQDIGQWNVIFKAALFHNHPHRWWTFDNGKHTNRIWKTCTNCMCSFPLRLSKGEGLVGLHVCTILPRKCYRPWVLHVFRVMSLWKHDTGQKKTHHWKKASEPQHFSLSSASNAVLQYLFLQFWQASVDESNCCCNAGMNQSIDRI